MIKENWIDWVQVGVVGVLAPFFLFPSMKYVWILCVVPGIWIWRWIYKRKLVERTVLDLGILILVIQVFTTCLVVPDVTFSLGKIAGVVFGIALFYAVVALLKTEKLIKAGIILFIIGGFIFSCIGILGMIRYSGKYLDELFKISTLIPKLNFKLPGAEEGFHPNAVGGILILIIPLYFILIFSCRQRKEQNPLGRIKKRPIFIPGLIGLVVMSIVLILTQSRGSWIGLIISCIILFMLGKKGKKWGLIFVFLFIFVYIMLIGFNKIPLSIEEMEGKLDLRIKTWNFAVEVIGEHPVFGIGMNQLRKDPLLHYTRAHAHNHLLHTGSELGIPGLVAYLAILMGAGFMCYEVWRKSNARWMRMVALGLGCGQLAHFIFGMADSIPLGAKVGIFFWFSLALIAAMYNFMSKKI